MPADVGGEHRLDARALDLGAKLLRNERYRQREIGFERRHARLPLTAAKWIIAKLGLHGLHETRAVLPDAQGQAVAPQRPLGRIVVDGFEMLARALVARTRGDDGSVVEIGEAVGIDQKLELDLDAG